MKFFSSLFLILSFSGFLFSCGDTELTSGSVDLPVVELSCDLAECDPGISSTFALVYISRSACEDEFDILYSSTSSLGCDSSSCTGTTSGDWVDSQGNLVDKVSETGLYLCAHIDVDASGVDSFTAGDIIFSKLTIIDGRAKIQAGPDGWSVF